MELKYFILPTKEQSEKAIGLQFEENLDLRKWLEPNNDFTPVPNPTPKDWLAKTQEPGQTFSKFMKKDFKKM